MIERKIGETFEYNGKTYVVSAGGCGCDGCAFVDMCPCGVSYDIRGRCSPYSRADSVGVIFTLGETDELKESFITPAPPNLDSWLSAISVEWQKQIHDAALDAFVFRFWDMSNAALSRVCGVSRGKIKRIRKKILRKNKESI